jgi:hypothetical protein
MEHPEKTEKKDPEENQERMAKTEKKDPEENQERMAKTEKKETQERTGLTRINTLISSFFVPTGFLSIVKVQN